MKRRIITLFCLNNTDKTELLKKYSIDQTNSTYEKPYVSETDHIHDTIDNTFTEESIVNEKPSNKKYVLIISFLIAIIILCVILLIITSMNNQKNDSFVYESQVSTFDSQVSTSDFQSSDTNNESSENCLIASYKNKEITEKELLDKLYMMDEYKAGGHVITNVDVTLGYELVTRSDDRKTIKLYKLINNIFTKVAEISADIQTNLIYVDHDMTDDNFEHKCYFETINSAENNQMMVRIYYYDSLVNTLVTEKEFLTEIYSDGKMEQTKYMTKDGNELDENEAAIAYKYICGWQESFNDSCYKIVPATQTEDVLELYEESSNSYYSYKLAYDNAIQSFCYDYYTSGDTNKFKTFGLRINGVSEIDAHILAKHEITARHNLSFQDPLITAFMNKNPDYNANPYLTLDEVEKEFNEHEKFNYDNYPKY